MPEKSCLSILRGKLEFGRRTSTRTRTLPLALILQKQEGRDPGQQRTMWTIAKRLWILIHGIVQRKHGKKMSIASSHAGTLAGDTKKMTAQAAGMQMHRCPSSLFARSKNSSEGA